MKKSPLDEHKMKFEDPHPKRVAVIPTKRNKLGGVFSRIGRDIKYFFVNIKLAIKELVEIIM